MQHATREQGSKRFRVDSSDTSLQERGRGHEVMQRATQEQGNKRFRVS